MNSEIEQKIRELSKRDYSQANPTSSLAFCLIFFGSAFYVFRNRAVFSLTKSALILGSAYFFANYVESGIYLTSATSFELKSLLKSLPRKEKSQALYICSQVRRENMKML